MQVQLAAKEAAKDAEAKRNKRLHDSRQLARMADQQQHEVENTDQAEGLRVHGEDERQRDGQDARDTYEAHKENVEAELYRPEPPKTKTEQDAGDDVAGGEHIDLSA